MYKLTGNRGAAEQLAMMCGSRRQVEATTARAREMGWQDLEIVRQDNELAWRSGVQAAARALFAPDTAYEVERSDAFGALAYLIQAHARAHDLTPTEVLQAVDDDDQAYAARADDPAAFLAAKVRDLPNPTQPQDTTEPAATRTDAEPRKVVEVIDTARAFVNEMDRVGAEEFTEALLQLPVIEAVWVLDRLDDVRQAVAQVVEHLACDGEDTLGVDTDSWNDIAAGLEDAGFGLCKAIRELDPVAEHTSIVKL